MRKLGHLLIVLVLLVVPFVAVSCSCSLDKYKSEDIKNLYKTIYENQINIDDGENTMFGSDYTISIEYAPIIENIEIDENSSNNEYNLYAIDKTYNLLFECVFRYYENWNENFYEKADEVITAEEFSNLYKKLEVINTSLIDVNRERAIMQEVVTSEGVDNVPSYVINHYIFKLNILVEQSIDFVTYFRELHVNKIFTDTSVYTNTVTRTIDDMLLSFAQFVYVDNIKPFNNVNEGTEVCDLSLLIHAHAVNNEFVKIDYLKQLDTTLRSDIIDALNNSSDINVAKDANQYIYYSNILRQNILTLTNISDNINYYRLSLYRYGAIDGGVEVYTTTISDKEHSCYVFLANIERFIVDEYLPILTKLT